MPLNRVKAGSNMYQGWVTHTHTHLGGECSHGCSYCYVDHIPFGRPAKYKGEIRLISKELAVKYGSGKTIFIEHLNDLFARDVPREFIELVLQHCREWPANTYVFQTKNPERLKAWRFPKGSIIGITLETNRDIPGISNAPSPRSRADSFEDLNAEKKFITIEPVLDFDVCELADMIWRIDPFFVNLGADSKNHGLPEPTVEKVGNLVKRLKKMGIDLREKHNLERLKTFEEKG